MNVKHLKALIPALVLLSSLDARAEAPANKQLVLDFARLAFQEKQLHQAFQLYVAPDYIQHNPHAADGVEASLHAIEGFQQQFPQFSYEIKRVASEGDLVFLHVHGKTTPEDRGSAIVDIFRVDDGRIVEHWDVIQPVPENSVSKHPLF